MKSAVMANALVSVRDLHKVFQRGGQRIDVLQGVNLDIPEGDYLSLMGPSGSGKTTLLNLIGGLDTPTEGSITVAGDRIDKLSGGKLLGVARAAHRVRLPALQPAARAHGGAERRAAAAAHEAGQGRPPEARLGRAVGRRPRRAHAPLSRASCRAARSSASASRAPSSPIRRCSSATSRPAISTGSRATRSSSCSRRSIAITTRPSSW